MALASSRAAVPGMASRGSSAARDGARPRLSAAPARARRPGAVPRARSRPLARVAIVARASSLDPSATHRDSARAPARGASPSSAFIASRSPSRASSRGVVVTRAAMSDADRAELESRAENAGYDDGSGDASWNDGEATANIPISFFGILNLSPARASPAAIEAAYVAVIQRELVDGFSDSCLAARADLVDAAAQVISDPELRAEHESDLKNGRLTPVPASQLGGALALVQEAGEHEAVIEYAPACLAVAKSRAARRDITLSAALAHCELSHNALTSVPPRVGEGCELLDIASQILVAEAGPRFSRELQDTINLTLCEMAPAYVIELIAMPLAARKERRAGVMALRQILWADGDAALVDRDAYVMEVNRHLTAKEIVDLFLEAPEHVPADAEEVYQSAIAHIVAGYKERRPMLIADADEMLAQLEEAAYQAAMEAREQAEQISRMAYESGQPPPAGTWATPPPAEPVNVERAVCQLLLGRVEDAAYSLGMGSEPTPYPLDPEVERFVAERSPSGDYAEGLCALADRWIADVAFPSFRDSAKVNPVPTIAQWFDEPAVTSFCERFDRSPRLARFLASAESALGSAADAVAESFDGSASAAPGLRADASDLSGKKKLLDPNSNLARFVRANPGASNVALGGALVLGAALAASGVRSGGVSVVGSTSSASSSAAAVSPREFPALLGASLTNAADAVAGAALSAAHAKAPEVDARVAEQIVRRWQAAKAQALGAAHNLRPLEAVLEGPMLQQWLTRAEDVKAHGWAWEYQLNALTIDKVEAMTPERVMVEATLTEVAVLKDRARTEDDDKYESTYKARYELRRAKRDGGVRAWKIVGGSVVY